MGNSPSVGLGGGSAYSSRDVRIVNPEKEVDRPTASRVPTHNEYTELPASLKPHSNMNSISFIIICVYTSMFYGLSYCIVLYLKAKNRYSKPLNVT